MPCFHIDRGELIWYVNAFLHENEILRNNFLSYRALEEEIRFQYDYSKPCGMLY